MSVPLPLPPAPEADPLVAAMRRTHRSTAVVAPGVLLLVGRDERLAMVRRRRDALVAEMKASTLSIEYRPMTPTERMWEAVDEELGLEP